MICPELVMPAGDLEKLKIAFAYGADAVYAGVPAYSLRARENRFQEAELKAGIEYAHAQGKRVYLTMNIFAHNRKVGPFLDSFVRMSDLGPEAVIMSDVGLIREALKLRPDTVIHLSTQANVTNWSAAAFWRDLGVKRIILSRELSLAEIAEIHERVPDIELEAFVQGSICIAYSGRCLISNYLNHRDANQGTCTNSCRWNYALALEKGSLVHSEREQVLAENEYQPLIGRYALKEVKRAEQNFIAEQFELDEDEYGTYVMNSKDLCAIELLAELRSAGVSAFKAEGRTKSLYYVAVVSRAYRRAIDDMLAGKPFDIANLREVASCSSRTLMTGFLLRNPREHGENFTDGDSLPLTHRFAGKVVEYDAEQNIAWVEVRNRLATGDVLEWLTPIETVSARVDALIKRNGSIVSAISGGMICGLAAPLVPAPMTLLRQPLAVR